ncbi:MAG: HEAT repeat domain-containing protein [Myxococcales bacterium]
MRISLVSLVGLLVLTAPVGALGQPQPRPSLSPADLTKLVTALRGVEMKGMKVRLQAALILGRSGGEEALQPLADCLADDPDFPVRAACAMSLGNMEDVHAIEPLVARLEDPEALVRQECGKALFRYTVPEALPYLQVARERGSAEVRLVLVEVVAQIKDPQAGALLAELIGDASEKVRLQAAAVLTTMDGVEVSGILRQALDHPNYRVKANAAKLLGQRKEKDAVARLVELASSPLEAVEVQVAARGALRELRSELDLTKLAAAARDPALERKERARALILLSTVDSADSFQACLDVLGDPEPFMRGLAAQALAEMGNPRALPALRDAAAKTSNDRVGRLIQVSIRKLERGGGN